MVFNRILVVLFSSFTFSVMAQYIEIHSIDTLSSMFQCVKRSAKSRAYKRNLKSFGCIEQNIIYPGCEKERTEDMRNKCFHKKIKNHMNKHINSDLINMFSYNSGKLIYIGFDIGENGEIKKIRVSMMKKNKNKWFKDYELPSKISKEVFRTVKKLPKMIGGKHKGLPVTVRYFILLPLLHY